MVVVTVELLVTPAALLMVRLLILPLKIKEGIVCAALPLNTTVPEEALIIPLVMLTLPLMFSVVVPML